MIFHRGMIACTQCEVETAPGTDRLNRRLECPEGWSQLLQRNNYGGYDIVAHFCPRCTEPAEEDEVK